MFKKLSIVLVLFAVISFAAHAIIPHHEHGEFICFEQAHDKGNQAQDDCAGNIQTCCFDKQNAICAQNESNESLDAVGYPVCCDYCFSTAESFSGFGPEQPEIINKPYLNLYTSAALTSANTLRGPPQTR
jgi:hypothetical protein